MAPIKNMIHGTIRHKYMIVVFITYDFKITQTDILKA